MELSDRTRFPECDHTSVGILVRRGGLLLLIERAHWPQGYAPPAGHVDASTSFEDAARRELHEEVGLIAEDLVEITGGRRENPCERPGGSWHEWKIYAAEATGELQPSIEETKQVRWCGPAELQRLADRSHAYKQARVSQTGWERSPGLEPVWYDWLMELRMVDRTGRG